jgi:hypothetical protein
MMPILRRQDFQFSAMFARIVSIFNDLLFPQPVAVVTVSCGVLSPVTPIE